jgi:Transcription initiation factor TFIID component TAF4 family
MEKEQPSSATHQIVSVFQKVFNANRASEQARLAKRAKRGFTNPTQVQTPVIAPAKPPKRLTKKDKKAAKMSDAQRQKSANETARMAMGLGLGGSNKFQKSYSWLHGGTASLAASAGQKANTGNKKATTSNASLNNTSSTYGNARTRPSIGRGKRLGEWDENDDGAIQARDILLVLETDGQAVKALSRGYNTPEKVEKG